ncbi:hypothetical protein JL720_16744 [Aureococcus anophagefferens]|nr:hypothetical protein JL720_16744 [Aureococcus anophagefferens]
MAPGPPATWSACGRAGAGAAGYGEAPDDGCIARPEGAARPSAAPAPAEARADAMSGGMMDAKIDGTPFGVLMQQAVKLKTHVHKVDRVKFDRWPKFYQNTAFIKDDQKAERAIEDFDARMAVAQRYKAADAAPARGDPMQAGMHYEWARASSAGRRRSTTTGGRSRSTTRTFWRSPTTATRRAREAIDAFKLACYLNIARAYFKQREWTTARQACDWALRLDGSSDKALFLRATILVEPVSHGSTERDDAIVDLEQAETLLVAATAAAAARDDLDDAACERLVDDLGKRKKQVRSLLAELRRLRQLGKAQDKAYGGMFDRGEVYDGDETARRRLADAEDAKALPTTTRSPSRPATAPSRRRRGPRPSSPRRRSSSASSETATPRASAADVREAAKAKASAMSMRDLIRSLKALGVPHGHCDTKGELKDSYVLACVGAARPRPPPRCARAARRGAVNSWKFTFLFATLFLAYRLWTTNLLGPLLGGAAPGDAPAAPLGDRNPYLDADEPDFAARDWTDEF